MRCGRLAMPRTDMMYWHKLWTYLLLFIWILQATPLRNTFWLFSALPLGRLSHKEHLRYFIIKPREVEKCLNFHIVSIIDIISFLKEWYFYYLKVSYIHTMYINRIHLQLLPSNSPCVPTPSSFQFHALFIISLSLIGLGQCEFYIHMGVWSSTGM